MSNENSKTSFKYLFADFCLLIAAFLAMNYFKRGTFVVSPEYNTLLILSLSMWLLVSLLTKKFQYESYAKYSHGLLVLIRADLFLLFCIAFVVVIFNMHMYSRLHIFGMCALLFLMETVILTSYFIFFKKDKLSESTSEKTSQIILYPLLISDFVLLIITFFLVNYLKRDTLLLDPEYEKLLLIFTGLWIVTMFMTNKFSKQHFTTYLFSITPCIKSVIFMLFIMTTLMFGLQMFHYSRLQIFAFMGMFLFMELILWFFFFDSLDKDNQDVESTREVRSIMKQEYLLSEIIPYENRIKVFYQPIKERMKDFYFKDQPQVFVFFDKSLNLSEIKRIETMILDTSDPINFNLISLPHTRLMINLHKTNDVRWVNRYFLEAHKILTDGGYLAGRVVTNDMLRKLFEKKYPKYFREFLYVIHFIWARVTPKLNLTKRFYFNITKGKRRAISRAEVLGRLSFCGFKVIAEEYIDDIFYFIAQKVKTPSLDDNPSYGPFVRFERVGANGKLIYIYKFRTMYPYSEYLQDYVHEQNQLQDGGKFKDDFRVTYYGKIMRRLWLDELPMLYNWIKGELQFVGVRPLSQHYLSLYTRELQELRKKVKPGLVPPFYADMPKTLDEIMASEKRYIKAYLEKPFSTQWRYFWKCFWNIVVKKARSA
jgi:Ca2+/Na+ antiporter